MTGLEVLVKGLAGEGQFGKNREVGLGKGGMSSGEVVMAALEH